MACFSHNIFKLFTEKYMFYLNCSFHNPSILNELNASVLTW